MKKATKNVYLCNLKVEIDEIRELNEETNFRIF